jgi:hypothetical protein
MYDPNEANNLAYDGRYGATLVEMRARLDRWMRDTNDPLVSGAIPRPDHAITNDPDGLSPGEPAQPVSAFE